MQSKQKILILIGAIVLLGIAAWQFPIAEWLTSLVQWIEANRETAWIVFIVAYIAATVLMLPGLILTLAAGYVFGLVYGTLLVSVSSVVGATAAFMIGRSFGRDWVREKIGAGGQGKLAAIDKATEKKGFLVMLLLRLSPIFPFNVMNYLMSLTGMSLKNYVLGSWIGMLPGTILYVYIGSAASDLTALLAGNYEAGDAGKVLLVVGLLATIVATVLIARFAAKTLNETIGEQLATPTEDA
ncbi:MAG: TVP38/TMEM64 family protein [Pseudomonadota bacterium]